MPRIQYLWGRADDVERGIEIERERQREGGRETRVRKGGIKGGRSLGGR